MGKYKTQFPKHGRNFTFDEPMTYQEREVYMDKLLNIFLGIIFCVFWVLQSLFLCLMGID